MVLSIIFVTKGLKLGKNVEGKSLEGEQLLHKEINLAKMSLFYVVLVAKSLVEHVPHLLDSLQIMVSQDMS